MYTHNKYNIDEKVFNNAYKFLENIYHTIMVVEIFCTYYAQINQTICAMPDTSEKRLLFV